MDQRGGRSYVNHQNGRLLREKPEDMTQLFGDRLVYKDHPRIVFRGKLDLVQGQAVLAQAMLEERGADHRMVEDLEGVVALLRQMTRSEVLDVPLPEDTKLLGLTAAELRAQSHDPKGYFGVEPMTLPHWSMGVPYAILNELRGACRSLETAGVAAFRPRPTPAQRTVLRWLNRLSSALHIMMCRCLSGGYGR